MREVTRLLPKEKIIYMGDTARVPYGNKSPETIIRYSLEFTGFLKNQIKMLVVACNTASSCALDHLSAHFDIPIIGVIEPGAEKAAATTRNGRIAVLGTRATINSGAYQAHIHRLLPGAKVFGVACPLLVPVVEENFFHHPAARLIVKSYLDELRDKDVDTILLGCTHYPFLSELIQEQVGADVQLVDSAQSCAEKVAKLLKEQEMETVGLQGGLHKYFVSDDPVKFRELGEKLFGGKLSTVEKLSGGI